ncbi:MAG TPA: LysM peptidoglycan-binding domain-containing protein [Pirellulales bacterium]|jgi:nucleoid-associated protein YgaU
MPVQKKLFVVALVVLVGVGAAFAFRKKSTPDDEQAVAPAGNPTARAELSLPLDKPAPVSHLTGRIDPAERATDLGGATSTSVGDRAGFGLSPMPSASGGYSSIRPASEGAASVGGTIDAAPANSAVPSGAGFHELRRHKIADGDTLSGLAVRYLGSADRYREIYELNREVLANPDLLPIGTELKIPALGSKVSTPGSINNRPMVPVAPRPTSSPPPLTSAGTP